LFDLDGTLLNTNTLVIKSFQHTFREYLSLEVPDESLYGYFGEPLKDTFRRFAPERVEELVRAYREFNIAHHDDLVNPFPGVIETITKLHQGGLKLGVVTSKIKHTAVRGLELCGIKDYFEALISLEDTENHKPHPEPIYKALEVLDLKPHEVVMVGDSPYDIRCAKNAGVSCAVVGWSMLPVEVMQAERPDHVINDLAELGKLCLENLPE